ncbi:hypothetical protein [Kitasatospora sp. NPDC057500]|uniref:hypothetical protein n=1 Tax=Kitasatospora sp. NPDC057500 TaxID=3346151 RepID=UPI0036AB1F06
MRFFEVTGAPSGEDPAAWLAYAERLTAAGDPRGAAIRLERAGADRDRLAEVYGEVERYLGLDALRADGSWRFGWSGGFLDEAAFRLAPGDPSRRRALVKRLLTERPGGYPADVDLDLDLELSDPEQWEGVLIAALLTHPVSHRLRELDLRLTDYHHSAEQAASALAGATRPRLERLSFGYDFEFLFEHGKGSAGSRIDPMEHHGEGLVRTEIWGALPALRTLELEGAFLFAFVDHDGLTRLRTRGAVISDGSVFLPGRLPALTSLELELESDVFGVACSVDQLDELATTADWYPHLRNLDLGKVEFDAGTSEVLAALAESPLLPRLEALTVRDLVIPEEEGGPLRLAALAPQFAHLALRVAGAVEVEGVGEEEVGRVLPALVP